MVKLLIISIVLISVTKSDPSKFCYNINSFCINIIIIIILL